jgi:hypothetical protein
MEQSISMCVLAPEGKTCEAQFQQPPSKPAGMLVFKIAGMR